MVGERSTWFDRGHKLELSTAAELSRHLSDMRDRAYAGAPVLRNELTNRSRLSTTVASARIRVLELMVTNDRHCFAKPAYNGVSASGSR